MTRAGGNRKTAMAISGHKTESIFPLYDIVSRKDLLLAGEQMGRYLEEQAAEVQPKAVKERARGQIEKAMVTFLVTVAGEAIVIAPHCLMKLLVGPEGFEPSTNGL